MQLTVSPESLAALTADGTIRCLLNTRYPLPSRQSSAALALADQLVEELARAVTAQLGPPPPPPVPSSTMTAAAEDGGAAPPTDNDTSSSTAADTRLHAVLLERNRLFVCFDLFLHDCQPEVRRRVDESTAQPIHVALKSGGVCQMRRSPGLDGEVAGRYAQFREVDKGPRPYFDDDLSPAFYVNGKRYEGRYEDYGPEFEFAFYDDDEAKDETWELHEVCGDRMTDDGFAELLVRWKSGRETWEDYDDMARSEPEAVVEYKRRCGQTISQGTT